MDSSSSDVDDLVKVDGSNMLIAFMNKDGDKAVNESSDNVAVHESSNTSQTIKSEQDHTQSDMRAKILSAIEARSKHQTVHEDNEPKCGGVEDKVHHEKCTITNNVTINLSINGNETESEVLGQIFMALAPLATQQCTLGEQPSTSKAAPKRTSAAPHQPNAVAVQQPSSVTASSIAASSVAAAPVATSVAASSSNSISFSKPSTSKDPSHILIIDSSSESDVCDGAPRGKAKMTQKDMMAMMSTFFDKKGKKNEKASKKIVATSSTSDSDSYIPPKKTRSQTMLQKTPAPRAVAAAVEAATAVAGATAGEDDPQIGRCSICFVKPMNIILNCRHTFCEDCIVRIRNDRKPCPKCNYKFRSWRRFFS